MHRNPSAIAEDVTIIEQKMATLERENFDLKMRLFYKEKEALKDTSTLENEAERVVGILQNRDDTYDQLRRANEEAYNTISELRVELQLVKASKEGSNSAYETLLQKNQRLASLQLEENLKRERQAAQAIASHDASVISNLEADLEALQATHEADTKLVSECAGRVAELMSVIEEKNATIEKQSSALDAANEHIEVLKDRVSRQEIFLIRGEQQDLLPKPENDKKLSIENSGPTGQNGILPPPSPPRRDMSGNSLHSSSMSTTMNPISRRNLNSSRPTSFGNGHSPSRFPPNSHDYDDEDVVGSSMSLRPAPRLGQPFMSGQEDITPTNHYTPNTHRASDYPTPQFSLSDLSNTVGNSKPNSAHHNRNNFSNFPHSPAVSTIGRNLSPFPVNKSPTLPIVASKNFDTRGFEDESKYNGYLTEEAKKLINAELERDALIDENSILKQTLQEEKGAFRRLEETLAQVRSSSEEITLLEAEEIARLEMEMERISEERDKYLASNRSLEIQNEVLLQNQRSSNGFSENGNRSSPSNGGHSPSNKNTLSNQHNDKNSVGNSKAKDSALFDMYRRREVELLDALEGVVKKCHSLEEELKVVKKK